MPPESLIREVILDDVGDELVSARTEDVHTQRAPAYHVHRCGAVGMHLSPREQAGFCPAPVRGQRFFLTDWPHGGLTPVLWCGWRRCAGPTTHPDESTEVEWGLAFPKEL